MSDFQESYDDSPELKGVSILTETTKAVEDVDSDRFLLEFSEDRFATKDAFEKLEKALVGSDGKTGSKQYVAGNKVPMYDIFDAVEPPYNMEYLAKLYDANGVHAAAVDAKIDNIVGLGYYWGFSRKAEKIRERAALKDNKESERKVENRLQDDMHRLDGIISSLNSMDEFDEIQEKVLRDKFVTGNGYIEVSRKRDGSIGYVGHISSVDIRVRRNRDGFVQYIGDEPIFFRNFGDLTTPDPFGRDKQPNEIIHLKTHSPTNDYYGVPEVVSVSNNIAGIEFANKYNIEYFENKAVPRYIIKTKGMKVDNKTKLEMLRFFETTTKGVHHRSLMIPLPSANAEIEFVPVETKKQEASFKEYIDQNTEHILARHRVPKSRLGLSGGSNVGDAMNVNKTFKETVCNPQQRLLEKKIAKIVREFTDLFVFKLHEYTLTDENEQSQIHERQLRMGILTPDEARAKLGYSARSDGKGGEAIDVRSLQELSTKMSQGAVSDALAQNKAESLKTRERDARQSSDRSDGVGATRSRNPKGTGAKER